MSSWIDTDVGRPRLHARDEEVRWLTAALGTAKRGAGVLLVVEGAAGTGKSRLVQEARVRGRARGALVLATRALPSDRGAGFGVLDRLGEADKRAGDAPAGELERADPNAFVRLIARLAAERPVVVAVDDVDRCDRPSLRALASLRCSSTTWEASPSC